MHVEKMKLGLRLSGATAVLAGLGALAGALFPARVYPEAALRASFMPNDLVTLLLTLPALALAAAGARRGRLLAGLCWPGALLVVFYNAVAYGVALPVGAPKLFYLALAVLSAGALAAALRAFDAPAIHLRVDGRIPRRLAGGVLVGLGGLFFVWRGALLAQALAGAGALTAPELGTAAADVLTTPLWVAAGVLLWRRAAWGSAAGLGVLFQAGLLFVGLLAFFVLQPWASGAPFAVEDFVVIFGMSWVVFIPLGLFARGVWRAERDH